MENAQSQISTGYLFITSNPQYTPACVAMINTSVVRMARMACPLKLLACNASRPQAWLNKQAQ